MGASEGMPFKFRFLAIAGLIPSRLSREPLFREGRLTEVDLKPLEVPSPELDGVELGCDVDMFGPGPSLLAPMPFLSVGLAS